jgi:hypothetical protein
MVALLRALITPALFSPRPPPNREKREKSKDASFFKPLLKERHIEDLFKPLLSRSGGSAVGEEGLGW